jgi:hypothetical protein
MNVGMVFWLVIGGIAVAGRAGQQLCRGQEERPDRKLSGTRPADTARALIEGRRLYDWRGFLVVRHPVPRGRASA